jgi:hypothetical protein
VSRTVVFALLLGGLVAACKRSDPRFEKLTVGMPKDSALAVMGVEKPVRVDPYMVSGHYIEAMYFARSDADTGKVPDRELSPVIVIDGNLAAWGWERWDSIATANKIRVERK